jgi:hypothetical protein
MTTQPATLFTFLQELRQAKIRYRLSDPRDDAIMVEVAVPGERWEIEFAEDGAVEVEVFRSDGQIRDAAALSELLARHTD